MKGTKKSEEGSKEGKMLPSAALRHPLRVRILEVINEQDMSPIQFMLRQLAPDLEVSAKALSTISYHFRQLADMGCIEVVDTIARRGATEHITAGRFAPTSPMRNGRSSQRGSAA